jgi:hypothetical protein
MCDKVSQAVEYEICRGIEPCTIDAGHAADSTHANVHSFYETM